MSKVLNFKNNNFIKGALWIGVYAIASVLNDSVIKYYTTFLSSQQIVMFRFGFSALSLLPLLVWYKMPLYSKFFTYHAYRGALLYAGMLLYTMSLHALPLAVNVVGCFSIPLFVSILAWLFLKEDIRKTIYPTLLGFAGIVVALLPYIFAVNITIIGILLLAVAFFASLDVINKFLMNSKEGLLSILFYTALFTAIFSMPAAILHWKPVALVDLYSMAVVGISGNIVLYCLLKGFSYAPISQMQPIKYIEFPLAFFAGSLVFKDQVHWSLMIGFVLIGASVLYSIFMDRKSR